MMRYVDLQLGVVALCLGLISTFVAGCGDEPAEKTEKPICDAGTEGCPCNVDNTCACPLECEGGVCVAVPTDAGVPEEHMECAYGTGVHRNIFAERGRSDEEINSKITRVWDHFFAGDPAEEAIYFESGTNENGPFAYILDVANNDVRSEGMSYGMMISVQLNHKQEFDALWNWAKTFMWNSDPTHPHYDYFAWSLNTDGTPNSEGPAPDGEEYFAMALYFASGRWGNGEGIYNYRAEADRILSAMKNRQPITGSYYWHGEMRENTGVAMFNPENKMVRFSPSQDYFQTANGDHTDPSYHLPAFYELWGRWGPEEDRAFWLDAADISRDFLVTTAHPVTSLTPDYANFDGSPMASAWDADTAAFRSDAHRTAMNWSMDWAWWCIDPRQQTLSDNLQIFFEDKGMTYDSLYYIDGTPLEENYSSSGLIAINAITALSATDPSRSAPFVEIMWSLQIPQGEYRYYDGMLYMFALLHLSGNFRIYHPEPYPVCP